MRAQVDGSLGGDLDVDGLGLSGRGGGLDGGTDVRFPGNINEVADEGLRSHKCGGEREVS